MALGTTLAPLDWTRLSRLRVAAESGADELARALAHERFESDLHDRKLVQELEALPSPPPLVTAIHGVRVNPALYGRRLASLLADETPERRDRALVSVSRSAHEDEMATPQFLLLAYFCPTYRRHAMGLLKDGAASVYEGEPIVAEALGGAAPAGEPFYGLNDPEAVARLAAALSDLDLERYPEGDTDALLDFYDSYDGGGRDLDELVRDEIENLALLYAAAARSGQGMVVRG